MDHDQREAAGLGPRPMRIPASRRVVSVAGRLLPLFVVAAGLHAAGPLAAADPPQKDQHGTGQLEKELPLAWVRPAAEPLRIHVVRGLWSREYRLEEAVALAGAGIVTESWHAQGMGFGHPGGWDAAAGGSVPEFPDAAEDLLACHVLVICNVNANAFTPSQQRLIEEFVRHGGGLLLLGGRFAFGGQWAASGLADVAPVRCVARGFDLKGIPQGLVLSAGPDRPDGVGSAFRWNQSPRVFWYHEVEPKEAARVTVAAEGRPLLVEGAYEEGRVAVFAGSVMGDPPAESLPFWQWDDWPRLLAAVLKSLAASSLPGTDGGLGEKVRDALAAALEPLDTLADGDEPQAALDAAEPLLRRVGKICRDPAVFEEILQAVAGSDADPPPGLAEFLGRRAAEFPGKQADRLAETLVASGKPGKTAVGLRLLGATRTAAGADRLLRLLASGKPETAAAAAANPAGDLLSPEVVSAATPKQQETDAAFIRQAALEGLARRGDPAALPAIRAAIAGSRPRGRFDAVEAYAITADHRLHQAALVAAVACGDADAAAPLAAAILGTPHVASRARSGWNGPKESETGMEGSLPFILGWQGELHAMLRGIPVDRLVPLAAAIAAVDDIRIVPGACAAFGGRPLAPSSREAIRTSTIKGVAALAEGR